MALCSAWPDCDRTLSTWLCPAKHKCRHPSQQNTPSIHLLACTPKVIRSRIQLFCWHFSMHGLCK